MNQQARSAVMWSVADLLRDDYKQCEYGMTKLIESDLLAEQAMNNSKQQFASSPDLTSKLMNAITDAFATHTTMSKQALDSQRVRDGLKDILLGPAMLYVALRNKAPGANRGV
jgi:type I restriction enzyme R subunit